MHRTLGFVVVALSGALIVSGAGCGQTTGGKGVATGGASGTGGTGSGGISGGTGGASAGTGGAASGGAGGTSAAGGTTGPGGQGGLTGTGGATSSGGAGTGGSTGSGGKTGVDDGGAGDVGLADTRGPDLPGRDTATGGTGTGGTGTGGTGTGGTGTGGMGTGGKGTGGAGTGGAGTGGATGSGGGTSANITVWLAGDSTMANGSTPCPVGWGKQFQALFGSKVKVTNSAQGGRSVQTWLYDVSTTMGSNGECTLNSTTYLAAWTAMLDGMKAGDYLLIQFGINDTDSTCNRHVGTALFKTYFGMMAQAAKDRGANPIFLTPVSSISCSGSTARGSRGTFATATKEAGTTYSVPVIDLEQLSVALYNSLGFCPLPGADTATTFESGAIGDFFCEDHTHFEAAGATQIAGIIAKALKDQGIGLASYLQ
jgi:lysophospholipase L1-like esterase